MALCNSCSAPLPPNVNRCRYCHVRNDIDLHGKHKYSVATQQSDRICPHCDKPLQTIKLKIQGDFHIERCKTCFGLFFDLGEIETLLDSSVSNVADINLKLIKSINKDRYKKHQAVKYVKCPCCRILMNRVNFGHRSGVIVDKCSKHGIWVDSGEITHLMEWKKAGGELLNEEQQKQTEQKVKTTRQTRTYLKENDYFNTNINEPNLIENISSLIFKLFG